MRFISTKVHGVLDYLVGVALLLAPTIFGFDDTGAGAWVPRIVGILILGQSLLTRYELGLIKMLPMSMHLMMDYLVNLVLIASPWLFGFADQVWVPHVVVGVMNFLIALMTETQPEYATTMDTRI